MSAEKISQFTEEIEDIRISHANDGITYLNLKMLISHIYFFSVVLVHGGVWPVPSEWGGTSIRSWTTVGVRGVSLRSE